MLADKINKYLTDLPSRPESKALRGSSAGSCGRALGYTRHGAPGEKLSSRTHLVFELGNTIETQLMQYAVPLGLTDAQKEVSMTINGEEIKGHIDGLFKDELGEQWVIDFKSINTLGFKRAAGGFQNDKYVAQLHFYMKALGLNKSMLVYYNKDTSHLCEQSVFWDETVWQKIENRFREVINSTPENLPGREYEPNEKGIFPFQCSYCPHSKICWPDAEVVFDKNYKPIMKLKN